MTSILEGPTYIAVRRYPDGETWIDETQAGATVLDAVRDLDNLHQVLMLEGGKIVDVSGHAAERWWLTNGFECETTFDIPQFIHDNYRDAYSELQESRYSARCDQIHNMTTGPR